MKLRLQGVQYVCELRQYRRSPAYPEAFARDNRERLVGVVPLRSVAEQGCDPFKSIWNFQRHLKVFQSRAGFLEISDKTNSLILRAAAYTSSVFSHGNSIISPG